MSGFDLIDIIPQFSRDRFVRDSVVFYFSLDHPIHVNFYIPNRWQDGEKN